MRDLTHRASDRFHTEWLQLGALAAVSLFAFFHHLGLDLFGGSEGLYAVITREMVRSREYVHLTYEGQPYFNKPSLFFWLLAASTRVFGDNEFALRLPSVLFGLGTVALTYQMGKILFSPRAGFWAALVVPTNYVFLWFGRRVLLDTALTFFMTLSLLAFVQGYRNPSQRWWYPTAFLAMALGTMTKALHAFVLPLLVILAFLVIRRDLRPFQEKSFLIGLGLFLTLTVSYYAILGQAFRSHFLYQQNVDRVFSVSGLGAYTGDRPFWWYGGVIWYAFFPWSALIPSAVALLWKQRTLRTEGWELFVLLWAGGVFLALTLAQGKREPYLMPLVPALGLLIGNYYNTALARPNSKQWFTRPLQAMLALLALAFALTLVARPSWLHRTLLLSPGVFPPAFAIVLLACCGVLGFAVARRRLLMALYGTAVLSLMFVFAVVQFVLPALQQSTSVRHMVAGIQGTLASSPGPFLLYSPGKRHLSEEVVYYLDQTAPVPHLRSEEALVTAVQKAGQVIALMERPYLRVLEQRGDLSLHALKEYRQPKQDLVLVSIQFRQAK